MGGYLYLVIEYKQKIQSELYRDIQINKIDFDEPEFTNHIGTIISNSVSTYETAASNAKKNHGMYARIFTCTPKIYHWGYKTSLIAGNSEVDNQQPRLIL